MPSAVAYLVDPTRKPPDWQPEWPGKINEEPILRIRKLEKNGILTRKTLVIGTIMTAIRESDFLRRQRNHGADKSGCAEDNPGPTRG
jgi:hypothetical protein